MNNIKYGTKSFWMTGADLPSTSRLKENLNCDVCIVGAGIAGLTCAYLLLKEGKSVIVLEKETIASGESSRTTAHLVTVLDNRFYVLATYHGREGAMLAAESHTAAITQVENITRDEKIDCDFRRIDGYLFAAEGRPQDELKRELEAMYLAGLADAEMKDNAPISTFSTGPCIYMPGQAKLHPLKYLSGLANTIIKLGGKIFTHSPAQVIEGGKHAHIRTDDCCEIKCKAIVVAANTPVNDVLAVHSRQEAYRSYVITALVPKNSMADALYWDTGFPYHYIRIDTNHQNELYDFLTVGGEDHKTGQEDDPNARFEKLECWVRARFSIGEVIYKWSGQIMEPNDGLAFIGRNPFDHKNVFIITGDSGNGMTHGTIGGMLIRDTIMQRPNRWEHLYRPLRHSALGAISGIKDTANFSLQFIDWLAPGDRLNELEAGKGIVIRKGFHRIAVYKDYNNKIHALNAVCKHLGCIVRWNETEHSWDCPCHGSRYSIDGKVINGPARTGLTPYLKSI